MTKENSENIPTLEEFQDWMRSNVDIVIDTRHISHYNNATKLMKEQLEDSSFWKLLCKNIIEYNDEYQGKGSITNLLKERKAPIIQTKPGISFIDKVYRENVINNESKV